jgi:intergrase/recombinase
MDMRLCRRIFASWLVQSGIDSTTVDMLQGRCPANVLARHYQTPSKGLKDRVLDAVSGLQKEITMEE